MNLPEIDHAGQTAYLNKKPYVALRNPETDELGWHEVAPRALTADELEAIRKEVW